MTDANQTENRSYHTPTPDTVTFRDADEVEGDEEMMEIRMPIASTGDVRNQGDEPLSGAELRGMAQQVDTLTRGVFPEHGHSSAVDDGVYSQFEKLGYWADADLQREAAGDDSDLLMATARMPDPETLPAATGKYRQALAILKEQAKRGIPVAASIGWRDDENAPGGVDLMEASIVGIPADPRTNTKGGTDVLARAAVEAGADPDEFVSEVRRLISRSDDSDSDPDNARPFGPPGDPNRWEDHSECVAEVEDWDGVDDPDAYCAWAKSETEDRGHKSNMTETDTADTGGTDDEQNPDDGETETTERAPEDVAEDELLTFVAMHLEGMDESDLSEAIDAADAEYIGEVDVEALAGLVSTVTGAEYGDVTDAMSDLMDREMDDDEEDEEEETQGDGYDDKDEEDEDDERSVDTDADADTDDSPEADDATARLTERLDELEAELESVRSGETEVTSPQKEQAADADGDGDDTDPTAEDEQTRDSEDVFSGLGDHISAR